jgi:hypothetical protein
MTVSEVLVRLALAALGAWTLACGPDDQAETAGAGAEVDAAQEALDREVCREALDHVFETECPAGFGPVFHHGDTSDVLFAEEVAIPICGDQGLLVDFGVVPGATLVGYEATKNSVCAFGCFGRCNPGQVGCFDLDAGWFCGAEVDEQSCTDFVRDEGQACGGE